MFGLLSRDLEASFEFRSFDGWQDRRVRIGSADRVTITPPPESRAAKRGKTAARFAAYIGEDTAMPETEYLSPDPVDELSKEKVQERVDGWLRRLRNLFEGNHRWAQEHNWNIDETASVRMNEEQMRTAGVTPTNQPVQRLSKPGGGYALFKPKGLWVIGANGRIDLYTNKGAFIIVDRSDFGEETSWVLFGLSDRREGIPYEPNLLSELV